MRIPLVRETAAMGEDGELDALRRIFGRIDVDGVVVGAIASDYQHSRVNRIADEFGLRVFAPLWRHDPRRLVYDYLEASLDIAFSSVSTEGLDASWLGRRWDERVIRDLLRLQETHAVHPCGEGGEFETLVLDAPPFEQAIDVVRATPDWRGTSGVWRVIEARLAPKPKREELTAAGRVESLDRRVDDRHRHPPALLCRVPFTAADKPCRQRRLGAQDRREGPGDPPAPRGGRPDRPLPVAGREHSPGGGDQPGTQARIRQAPAQELHRSIRVISATA